MERSRDFAVAVGPESIVLRRPDVLFASHLPLAEYVEQVRSAGVPVLRITMVLECLEQVASALVELHFLRTLSGLL